MHLSFSTVIEILGIIAFTVSGAFSAMQKRLDVFGVFILGFVTAIGGGTLRDLLIGNTPVSWLRDVSTPLIILATTVVTILFKKRVKNFKVTLVLFDALGLGLFAIIGIQKGLDAHLGTGACIALGTITGCFGGVLRDMLLNHIPVLFHKELYAIPCITGGICYVLLLPLIEKQLAESISVVLICSFRLLSVRHNWRLPRV
ncbi:trimeric intracellular cation channel family protein [Mucilaginibacter sp. 14171R-50]|uniref:trimeric intracellular cation channel family protein n=1 Tax=Mucilaginibacter sp. 14171R-50 TaxID=2703789 RepID=UPI00138CA403|nr:trimeric intracellular cation channel family protein [Mucilaginibacter sp. 14171R-50]QHS54129.1 trimeric intracellular cation channel family protein [Mucilaginibacter sp. 14171R-50]